MKCYKIFLSSILITSVFGCTKLNEKLNDSFEKTGTGSGAVNVTALLNKAYSDFGVFTAQDQVFSLEENTADQTLVPTRGGDWDDNGVWRVLHAHAWDATHGQTSSVFTALGTMESDATTVLANGPTAEQAAEAYFIRTVSQFYLLDLYGQVPFRTVATYNAIGPSQVLGPQEAIDTMVATIARILPDLPASNSPYRASPDAANFLLMKILLNKGAFLNRAAPTFDAADMAQVITLGQQMMTSGKYSLTADYFDNFGPNNATTSKEMILAYPNNGTPSNNGISASGINARWMMTLHYNSWDQAAPNAGWNGFSTVADFYNSFEAGDKRLTETYPGVTDVSGLRVGLLAGQQVDQNGNNIKDRKGNNLIFTPDVSLVETDPNTLEDRGIRVIKYPPDYSAYSSGNQHNQQVFFRYADVVLMVAEAQLRTNDAAATATVNILRTARNASPIASLDLTTLLAERGRELYWESWRRQDLIRFGKFLDPWALKTTDDPKYLLFPIPPTQLVANPNLKQNPGY